MRHPRARRYVVSVRDDGGVRVTLPRWGSLREARAFASEQQGWIDRQRQRLETARATMPVVPESVKREAWARAKRELPPRLLELAAGLGLDRFESQRAQPEVAMGIVFAHAATSA